MLVFTILICAVFDDTGDEVEQWRQNQNYQSDIDEERCNYCGKCVHDYGWPDASKFGFSFREWNVAVQQLAFEKNMANSEGKTEGCAEHANRVEHDDVWICWVVANKCGGEGD